MDGKTMIVGSAEYRGYKEAQVDMIMAAAKDCVFKHHFSVEQGLALRAGFEEISRAIKAVI